MGLEGEGDNSMYNPLLDIEIESDQPAPSSRLPQPPHTTHMQSTCTPWPPHATRTSLTAHTRPPCTPWLTHDFHNHHTQPICSPHASYGHHDHHHPPSAHPQPSLTTMQPSPTKCSPTLHLHHASTTVHKAHTAHPYSRTSFSYTHKAHTAHPCNRTSSQLSHIALAAHPCSLWFTYAHLTLTRSPTCSPHTSQLTHGLHDSSKATPCGPNLTTTHPWLPHHHHAPSTTLMTTI